MNIFKREMKRNRKAFLIWVIILILYNVLIFAMYPALYDQADSYKKMVESMPKELMAAFNADSLDFTNILSFFSTYSYLYFLLFGSIYAMILGSGIISKEESEKTIEFLLAKPVKRSGIISGKAGAAFLYLLVFNVLFSASSFLLTHLYNKNGYDAFVLLLMCVGPLLVTLMFAAIGMLISVFIVKAKSIIPVSIGVVMLAFILGMASDISERAKALKYFSPFKYVDSKLIMEQKKIEPVYLLIFAIAIVGCMALTYLYYNKKDITV